MCKEVSIIIFLLQPYLFQAQLTIQFIPALNGQSVNGLFTAQVNNTGRTVYTGKFIITVTDAGNRMVMTAIIPSVSFQPGINPIQTIASQTNLRFGNSPSAAIAAQTGRFPEEEYDYCFEFSGWTGKPNTDEQVFENCYHYAVPSMLPLSLVFPADGDEVCNLRPGFSWQPVMPMVSNCRYRLVLAEKKGKQLAADALLNNIPILSLDDLSGYGLPYPLQWPDLQKDKQYAWQVTAFAGKTKIGQSEIWLFSVDCHDKKPDTMKDSYRQLSGMLNGNFYITSATLHIAVLNPYSPTPIHYSITNVSDPTITCHNLPALKVHTGLNKIDLPLEDITNLQVNNTYLLKITNIGDHILYLQFIYKGNE